MRIPLCLLILFCAASSPERADAVIADAIVQNQSSSSRSADPGGNFAGRSGVVEKFGLGDARSTADTTWSLDVGLGINGPIPVIVVDQFGYPTKASKVAVIRDPKAGYDNSAHFTPGPVYALVDQSTGKIAKQGPPIPWNGGATDSASGDKVWWFDFSDVTAPGTYAVDIDNGLRSPEFQIDDRIYRKVLRDAIRMYFYQRAGFKRRPRRSDPTGLTLQAIWGPNRILKADLGWRGTG